MSSCLDTSIIARGSSDQLKRFVNALYGFQKSSKEQYELNGDCGYFDIASIKYNRKMFSQWDQEKLLQSIHDEGAVSASLIGPFGVFFKPSEVGLFECLADAVPDMNFEGEITGWTDERDIWLHAVLENGRLRQEEAILWQDEVEDEDDPKELLKKAAKTTWYNPFSKSDHHTNSE